MTGCRPLGSHGPGRTAPGSPARKAHRRHRSDPPRAHGRYARALSLAHPDLPNGVDVGIPIETQRRYLKHAALLPATGLLLYGSAWPWGASPGVLYALEEPRLHLTVSVLALAALLALAGLALPGDGPSLGRFRARWLALVPIFYLVVHGAMALDEWGWGIPIHDRVWIAWPSSPVMDLALAMVVGPLAEEAAARGLLTSLADRFSPLAWWVVVVLPITLAHMGVSFAATCLALTMCVLLERVRRDTGGCLTGIVVHIVYNTVTRFTPYGWAIEF